MPNVMRINNYYIKLNRFYFSRPDGKKERDKEIYISVKQIISMQHSYAGIEEYTEVLTPGGTYLVEETPEEILEIMKSGV